MKINELNSGSKKVDLTATIVELSEIKTGDNWEMRVATIKDATGTVQMSLWGEDAQKVAKGDKIEVKNGYVKVYQDKMQVSAGKYGSVTVVEHAKVPQPSKLDDKPFLLQIAEALEFQSDKLREMAKDCRSML